MRRTFSGLGACRKTFEPRVFLLLLLLLSGCFATVHTVGDGPLGGEVRVHRVWYAAWGFLPINRLDSRNVVGAADHYRVTTSFGGGDLFLNFFTAPFGFVRQTTLVEK